MKWHSYSFMKTYLGAYLQHHHPLLLRRFFASPASLYKTGLTFLYTMQPAVALECIV